MFYSKKLKEFKEIKHCFFSRRGGFSKGIYKSLNCGRGSNDEKKTIQKNLNYISKKMRVNSDDLILMHQTHSNKVKEINKNNFRRTIYCDSIITRMNQIALGVVTADCVPILVFDKKNKIIGCIHAGWKGALKGIIKNTILKMKKFNFRNELYASIGPCIGKKNYEVDNDFFKKFVLKSKKNLRYFSKKNKKKKFFNLRKFVSDKLLEMKVKIDHVNLDTFKETNLFFSCRRATFLKQKDYGRCISVIRLI